MYLPIYNVHQFRQLFVDANRASQFSYEGLETLFNYIEDAFGDDYEADAIGICCSYSEYDSFEEYAEQYDHADEEELLGNLVGTTANGSVVVHNW